MHESHGLVCFLWPRTMAKQQSKLKCLCPFFHTFCSYMRSNSKCRIWLFPGSCDRSVQTKGGCGVDGKQATSWN